MTQLVENLSSSYPYSAVVYIESTYFQTGNTYTGSGVVVGENDILTASHVIYSASEGGVADLITVYPGKDGWSEPYRSYTFDLVNYFEVDDDGDGLLSKSESQYDLALLGFSEDLGNSTGWFGLDPNATSGSYHLTGYPGIYSDYTGPRMADDYGYLFENPYYSVFDFSTIDSNSGNSGGPIWYENDTGSYVVGIVSTGSWAADISLNYSTIIGWIEDNDYLLTSIISDDYASDSSTTGRVTVNGTTSGVIETETDEDWFSVFLDVGITYLIDLKGADTQDGTLADPYLRGIYSDGNSGVTLVSGTSNTDGGIGLNTHIEFIPDASGTYYIAAGAQNNKTGSYILAVDIKVTPEMTMDWAEYAFPELFPKDTAQHFPTIEHDGVIYNARAYDSIWGDRYLGITQDERIFGLGDFTEYALKQFETIDHWAAQVLAYLSEGAINTLGFATKNDSLENLYDTISNWPPDQHQMEIGPLGGTHIIDQWFGA